VALRLLSALTAMAALAILATASPSGRPDASPSPSRPSAGAAGPAVVIETRGGDVWSWTEQVTGTAGCSPVQVLVDGSVVGAPVATVEGRFTVDVPLPPGSHEVTAACGSPGSAPAAPVAPAVTFVQRLAERPVARITVAVRGGRIELDGAASEPSHDGAPLGTLAWMPGAGNPGALTRQTSDGAAPFDGEVEADGIVLQQPERDGEYYVTLRVTDTEGRSDQSTTYFVVEDGRARPVDLDHEHPEWVDRAIVYGTVPPLFGDDPDCEPFCAVTKRLPYLADLGVNALWLSPINVSPLGDYGYAVKDYFGLNPDYGTEEEFRTLVETAHSNGIRVLMDFVPNHSSAEHSYFVDAQRHAESSRFWDFYDRDAAGEPTHYFDWTHLPNLNYENPEVRAMILAAFSTWVRDFDVDGFRVDVAWGVKMRRPTFWQEWRRELKRIKPDLLLLAEASARDPYYFSNGFDAAYDWTEELGHWAWQGVFDAPEVIQEWLDDALTNHGEGYPEDALIFRFLNNNDTGPRFVGVYGTDLTRVAAALLLTLPGIPELFTGDEIGALYEPYSAPPPLVWRDKFALLDHYRRLIQLRADLPSLRSRSWVRVETDPGGGVYSYVRTGGPDDTPVLVLLNFTEAKTLTVPLTGAVRDVTATGDLDDLLNDRRFAVQGSALRIPMEAFSARILVGGTP
jgi:cyclomaltodextrinase